MSKVTILEMGGTIIVPIQIELHDHAALSLQERVLKRIEETCAEGLIIDVSAIAIVDSFLGRMLGETAQMATLMGARTVLVGMKKEVVITLIELGLTIRGLHTALDLANGLTLLAQLKAADALPKTRQGSASIKGEIGDG